MKTVNRLGAAALALAIASPALAQQAPAPAPAPAATAPGVTELRYASSAPPKSVWDLQTQRWVKDATEVSGGKLKINAFIGSQLGSEQDTISQVARGRIDMGGYSITATSLLVPEIALLNIPFLFKDSEQIDCVLDNHLTKATAELLAKRGVHFLSWTEVGNTDIIGKKPYLKPEDLKGVKARSQPTKIGGHMWMHFGANPNPIPVTEVNGAFQTGLVEVGDGPVTYYMFSGLAKIIPVMTMTQHLDQAGTLLINKEVYDKLSAENKKALAEMVAKSPAALLRKEIREFEGKLREKHKAEGGTIVELTTEQRAVWRKGIEAAWPKMVETIGGESNAYWQAIQAGIKACTK
jgi:TRAP-type C4-dicarboxylate transport system substrate-binding protein